LSVKGVKLMLRKMLRAKIHRATITEAQPDYVGSITIDRDLMDAVDLAAGECVLVADIDTGARFDTYVFEGDRASGVICINGAAAKLVNVGDKIIIMAFGYVDSTEVTGRKAPVALVDEANRLTGRI
jgi:aspartate 1-decarboxylase